MRNKFNRKINILIGIAVIGFLFSFTLIGQNVAGSPNTVHSNGNMVLVNPGKPVPKIVISATATEAEKFAASEMQTYLGKITGRTFTVVTDNNIPSGSVISIGQNKLSMDYHPEKLEVEEYIMDIKPDLLLIVGGRKPPKEGNYQDRGTLYGVYDFLESLGVRWYRPEEWGENVPSLTKISVDLGKKQFKSYFSYRSGMQGYRWWDTPEQYAIGKPWCVRNRQNASANYEAKYGGGVVRDYDHSYRYEIPHGEYFATHPEYFALINGQRSTEQYAQLCLSNPEMQKLFAQNVIKRADKNPKNEMISIEPNDGDLWCECANCKAMDDPKQLNSYGKVSMSNRVFTFGNIIAKLVKEQRPNLKLGLLAYNTHTEIPSLVPSLEPSIAIQAAAYAGGYSDYSKDLRDPASTQNAAFLKIIEGFSKICSDITTYEYYGGYAWWGPMPVVHVLKDRLKEYHKLGLKGCYDLTCDMNWGPQGINIYMYTKLMWNPYLDVDNELDLYYKNYYGPAEKPMKAYHEYLEKISYHSNIWFSGGYLFSNLIGKPELDQMKIYLDQAKLLVKGNPLYEKRLEGVWAGYELTRRYMEMVRLANEGNNSESRAMANSIMELIESYPGEWVFAYSKRDEVLNKGDSFGSEMKHYLELKDNPMFVNPKQIESISEKWKFSQDKLNIGLGTFYFKVGFDDSKWAVIDATDFWENKGYPNYDGVGWYRRSITKPQWQAGKHLILNFGAVDGNAEVWLNGEKIGSHGGDVNDGEGWQAPFYFDITDKIKDGTNQISVRVEDTNGMGGIWKGVQLIQVDGLKE